MTVRLAAHELAYSYRGQQVLSRLDLAVSEGEILTILGASGSGKTTLLRLLLGFLAPDEGRILVRGRTASLPGEILLPPEERNLAVVFQDLALWPHMTVRQNLAFGLEARGVPSAEADQRIEKMLQRLDLAGKADRRPHELSGGERQRVAVARALVLEPDAVLLDEPLSNLDVGLKRELEDLFRSVFSASRAAVVYVTHDPDVARALGSDTMVIHAGRAWSIEELREDPAASSHRFVRALLEESNWNGHS